MYAQNRTDAWDLFGWMRSIRDSELPSSTRLVLLTMVTWIDNTTGTCFPSLATLAQGTGLAKSTVTTHLKRAEEAGYIRRTQRLMGRQHTSTLYQATMPDAPALHTPAWAPRRAA